VSACLWRITFRWTWRVGDIPPVACTFSFAPFFGRRSTRHRSHASTSRLVSVENLAGRGTRSRDGPALVQAAAAPRVKLPRRLALPGFRDERVPAEHSHTAPDGGRRRRRPASTTGTARARLRRSTSQIAQDRRRPSPTNAPQRIVGVVERRMGSERAALPPARDRGHAPFGGRAGRLQAPSTWLSDAIIGAAFTGLRRGTSAR
jgi:hypothetical protein